MMLLLLIAGGTATQLFLTGFLANKVMYPRVKGEHRCVGPCTRDSEHREAAMVMAFLWPVILAWVLISGVYKAGSAVGGNTMSVQTTYVPITASEHAELESYRQGASMDRALEALDEEKY